MPCPWIFKIVMKHCWVPLKKNLEPIKISPLTPPRQNCKKTYFLAKNLLLILKFLTKKVRVTVKFETLNFYQVHLTSFCNFFSYPAQPF